MRILMYHQVVEGTPPNIHAVSAAVFRSQMHWLHASGYRSVLLEDGRQSLTDHARDDKAVAITFDDGYLDCLTVALPILREVGFNATVYLIAGLIGKTRTWDDGDDHSRPPFLSWEQAREGADYGLRFGAHTMTHPNLTTLTPTQIEWELGECRKVIEDKLGGAVTSLSYPYGAHSPLVRRLAAKSGYELACACRPHYVGDPGTAPYSLQRLSMLATDTLPDFISKLEASWQRRMEWYNYLARAIARQGMTRIGSVARG